MACDHQRGHPPVVSQVRLRARRKERRQPAPTLAEVLPGLCEVVNLSVLDAENLRLHYARTLAHWLDRFERHASEIAARFDDVFVRTWRLYLAGAQASFTCGDLQLFQIVIGRAADNDQPATRRFLYEAPS